MKRFLLLISLLSSCAGYELTPSVSYTDKEGREIAAKVKIKPPKIQARKNDK